MHRNPHLPNAEHFSWIDKRYQKFTWVDPETEYMAK